MDDGQTIVEDTIAIEVNLVPETYLLTGDNGFCSGGEGANLALSGFEENTSYEIYRNGLPYGQFLENGTAMVPQGGSYTVVASNGGCANTMNGVVEVTEFVSPVANAGEDQVIASGQSATLNASVTGSGPEFLFQWSPSNQIEDPDGQIINTLPLFASGEFSLQVTDALNGCESEPDTVNVIVSGDALSVEVSASSQTVCPGTSVQLSALASGGSGEYSYQWTSNPQGFYDFDSLAQAVPLQNTTYYLTVSDGDFSVTDSVEIAIADDPEVQNVTGGGGICEDSPGAEISLDDSESNVYYSLYSEDGDLVNAVSGTGQELSLGLVSQEGSYYVTATHLSSFCAAEMDGEPIVFEYETPQAFAGEDLVIESGQTATLNGYATGGSGQFNY